MLARHLSLIASTHVMTYMLYPAKRYSKPVSVPSVQEVKTDRNWTGNATMSVYCGLTFHCQFAFLLDRWNIFFPLSNYWPDVTLTDTRLHFRVKPLQKKVTEWFIPCRAIQAIWWKTCRTDSGTAPHLNVNPVSFLHVYMSSCFLLMLYLQTVESYSIWLPATHWLTHGSVTVV